MTDEKFELPTYAATTAAGFKYSTKDMVTALMKLEWLYYEVDPEWKRFCSFGPEDMGGPFEKLGIIRKRPRLDTVVMNAVQKMNDKMNELMFQQIMGHPPGEYPAALPIGINIIESPLVPPGQAYKINVPPIGLKFPNPYLGIKFDSV